MLITLWKEKHNVVQATILAFFVLHPPPTPPTPPSPPGVGVGWGVRDEGAPTEWWARDPGYYAVTGLVGTDAPGRGAPPLTGYFAAFDGPLGLK